MKPNIQFILNIPERVIPTVRVTRSIDGSTGTATFLFKNPNILTNFSLRNYEVTGMYLVDYEGTLSTRDIRIQFFYGMPKVLESIYIMKNPYEWTRFMRFMERYCNTYGLVFTKTN